MKEVLVPQIKPHHWSTIQAHAIDCVNWEAYDYAPHVSFKLCHDKEMLYIRYDVEESYTVRREEKQDQAPVYQDSCVEFFFLRQDNNYINFELNADGILLAAIGKSRANRRPFNNKELKQIKRQTSEIRRQNNKYHWQITLGIPFDILGIAASNSYACNFYKCGDLSEKKHYLSWSPIKTDQPDFHRPEFFGKITFE